MSGRKVNQVNKKYLQAWIYAAEKFVKTGDDAPFALPTLELEYSLVKQPGARGLNLGRALPENLAIDSGGKETDGFILLIGSASQITDQIKTRGLLDKEAANRLFNEVGTKLADIDLSPKTASYVRAFHSLRGQAHSAAGPR